MKYNIYYNYKDFNGNDRIEEISDVLYDDSDGMLYVNSANNAVCRLLGIVLDRIIDEEELVKYGNDNAIRYDMVKCIIFEPFPSELRYTNDIKYKTLLTVNDKPVVVQIINAPNMSLTSDIIILSPALNIIKNIVYNIRKNTKVIGDTLYVNDYAFLESALKMLPKDTNKLKNIFICNNPRNVYARLDFDVHDSNIFLLYHNADSGDIIIKGNYVYNSKIFVGNTITKTDDNGKIITYDYMGYNTFLVDENGVITNHANGYYIDDAYVPIKK